MQTRTNTDLTMEMGGFQGEDRRKAGRRTRGCRGQGQGDDGASQSHFGRGGRPHLGG